MLACLLYTARSKIVTVVQSSRRIEYLQRIARLCHQCDTTVRYELARAPLS